MLVHRIMHLPYIGGNPAMMFGGKGGKQAFAESMKERFKLVKKPCRYAISRICKIVVKVAM